MGRSPSVRGPKKLQQQQPRTLAHKLKPKKRNLLRELRAEPATRNILTEFAQCDIAGCCNQKAAGTPRCHWHNKWLYRVSTDAVSDMFLKKLCCNATNGSGEGAENNKQQAREEVQRQAKAQLEKTQQAFYSALKGMYRRFGRQFAWPSGGFVEKRRVALRPFLTAVAKELVKPTGKLDISDSFAIDEVVERMYMVGLMQSASTMAPLEGPHMKALIQYFRVFHLDNAASITGPGVLQFVDFMFDRQDRMVNDLLFAEDSHIGALLAILNNPVDKSSSSAAPAASSMMDTSAFPPLPPGDSW